MPPENAEVRLRPVSILSDPEFGDRLHQYWRDLGVVPPAAWHARYLARLAQEQGQGRHTFWGCAGPARVGFCVLRLDTDWVYPQRRIGYVAEFCVLPEYRRQGWGRRLFAAPERWLSEQGCQDVELDVLPTNGRAIAFWAALGFRVAYHHMRRMP